MHTHISVTHTPLAAVSIFNKFLILKKKLYPAPRRGLSLALSFEKTIPSNMVKREILQMKASPFKVGMRKAYKGYFLISYLVISSGKT